MTERAIKARIKQIQDYPTFNDWSRGFCESIVEQINRGRRLSEKQMEVLTRIFNENTPEQVEKLNAWPEEYQNIWSDKAEILAFYYSKTPYYQQAVQDIQNGLVPQRNQFNKMLNNKYALKVLAEAVRPPRFNLGHCVAGNASCDPQDLSTDDSGRLSRHVYSDFKARGGFIIEISRLITSAARGAKRYKILPMGSTITFWVEERHLKNAPRPKRS